MDKLFCIFIGLSSLALATGQPINATLLTVNVTKAGCGDTRACFTDPAGCDPDTDSACLLFSTRTINGSQNFQLRGRSSGYIGVVLSNDSNIGVNDRAYICTNVQTFFLTVLDSNKNLTVQNNTSSVTNVSASVSNNSIQCMFSVSGLNATSARSADSTFTIALASGNLDANGLPLTPSLRAPIVGVDLSNPNSTNTANGTTTTASPSTNSTTGTTKAPGNGGNISLQQSFSQALLIVFGVLAMRLL